MSCNVNNRISGCEYCGGVCLFHSVSKISLARQRCKLQPLEMRRRGWTCDPVALVSCFVYICCHVLFLACGWSSYLPTSTNHHKSALRSWGGLPDCLYARTCYDAIYVCIDIYNFSGTASIFRAELYALLLAIDMVRRSKEKNFVIFSDSMSSLQSIYGFNLDSDFVQKFLKDYTF